MKFRRQNGRNRTKFIYIRSHFVQKRLNFVSTKNILNFDFVLGRKGREQPRTNPDGHLKIRFRSAKSMLKKNLANKIFGYLARCEQEICIWTLQIENFGSKWDENAEFDSAKI